MNLNLLVFSLFFVSVNDVGGSDVMGQSESETSVSCVCAELMMNDC